MGGWGVGLVVSSVSFMELKTLVRLGSSNKNQVLFFPIHKYYPRIRELSLISFTSQKDASTAQSCNANKSLFYLYTL